MPCPPSFSDAQAQLLANADYDVAGDLDKARAYVGAARSLIAFSSSAMRDGTSVQFDMGALSKLMNQALRWIEANSTPSDAQLLANPSVVHADFSGLNGYTDRWPPGVSHDC
jgi:hypothetical protein